MDNNLIAKLKYLKEKYEPEGFIILGVFGSYARNDQNKSSDIDILYKVEDKNYEKYPGWKFIELYDQIKADIEAELKLKADLADFDALNDIGKKYILPEVYYVA